MYNMKLLIDIASKKFILKKLKNFAKNTRKRKQLLLKLNNNY